MTDEKPYCEAQVGGMECGRPVDRWGEQCETHDPHRTTVKPTKPQPTIGWKLMSLGMTDDG